MPLSLYFKSVLKRYDSEYTYTSLWKKRIFYQPGSYFSYFHAQSFYNLIYNLLWKYYNIYDIYKK